MGEERRHVTLPPLAWAVIMGTALLMLTMVGLLIAQLSVLSDSHEDIEATDRKAGALMDTAEPLLREARPLAEDLQPLVREARGLARPLSNSTDDLAQTAEVVPELATQGAMLLDAALPLIRDLDPVVAGVADQLDLPPRMYRTLRQQLRNQVVTLEVQRASLAAQRESLAVQRETLAIQREALKHIQSIDRKTGGTPPPVPTPTGTP